MKRLLAPFAVAILIHVGLLSMGKYLNPDETVTPPKTKIVTMTMFQKETPKPIKPPIKKIKPPPPKKKNKPKEKPIKKVPHPPPVKEKPLISEPEEVPPEPEEIVEELPEEKVETGKDMANMQAINDAVPLYKTNPPPLYPKSASKRNYEGTAMLFVHVNKNGNVIELKVLESSGYPQLDKAAQKAVKSWQFSPGLKGNKKIDMWVKVPIRFALE